MSHHYSEFYDMETELIQLRQEIIKLKSHIGFLERELNSAQRLIKEYEDDAHEGEDI